ncbi:MAG: hypothetical protein NVSMB25_25780 [Thermoleophilaceae bacterium]
MPPNDSSLEGLQATVEEMLSDGEPLALIEETIEDSRLDEEQKAGLWLLAWSSRQSSTARRGGSGRTLAAVPGGDGAPTRTERS